MLTVARGGAEGATGGDDLCFKYPKHKDCTGMDFLPMLLAFPRINDYRGGASLLGLGDIVRKSKLRLTLSEHRPATVPDKSDEFFILQFPDS